MLEVVKFQSEHLMRLQEQKATAYLRPYFKPENYQAIENCTYSYTGISNGRVLICAGIFEIWPGRAEAWAILDQDCKKEFLLIHRAAKRFFDICSIKRIEATVDVNFNNAHRWALALGFKMEASRMRAYHPNGTDCALYARVN
jgi:hypothetical protein